MSDDDTFRRFVKHVWRRASRERAKVDRIAEELRRQGPFVIESADCPPPSDEHEPSNDTYLRSIIQRITGWSPPVNWDALLVLYCWRQLPVLVRRTTEEQFFNLDHYQLSPLESPFDTQSDPIDFIALWNPVTTRIQNQGNFYPKYFSYCLRKLESDDLDDLHRQGTYDGNALHLDQCFYSDNRIPSLALFELASENTMYKFSSRDWFVFRDPRIQPLGRLSSGFLGRFETAGEAREYAAACRDRYGITTCTGLKKRYLRKISYRW